VLTNWFSSNRRYAILLLVVLISLVFIVSAVFGTVLSGNKRISFPTGAILTVNISSADSKELPLIVIQNNEDKMPDSFDTVIDLSKYVGIRAVIPKKFGDYPFSEYYSCSPNYYDFQTKKCTRLCMNSQCTAVYTTQDDGKSLRDSGTMLQIIFNYPDNRNNQMCIDGSMPSYQYTLKQRDIYLCKDSFMKVHLVYLEPLLDRGNSFVSVETEVDIFETVIENEDASNQLARIGINAIIENFDNLGAETLQALSRD